MKAMTTLREEMTEEERQLFLCDVKKVCAEYFECDGKFSLETARNEKGLAVCLIFDARRVRKFRKPH